MKWKTFVVGWSLALALLLFAQRHKAVPPQPLVRSVVDLTHSISPQSPTYQPVKESPFQARTVASYDQQGYFARDIALPEHFATHIDAPAHLQRGAWTVDQIPPARLVGPLVVLDVIRKASSNADYQVALEDIAGWEEVNGQIPPGSVVMARTGWSWRWNSAKEYRNADARGVMHFPGWSVEAARFLVESRDAYGLGIDTLSADPGDSKDLPVHKYLGAHGVYGLENVADLGPVPSSGSLLVVAPAKLQDGSGGPVRILALVH